MALDRRRFLTLAAVGSGAGSWLSSVAFDAFPVFDLRPVFARAEALFPGEGAALSNAWRTRQFEYQWLRATSGRYADFWQTTEDGLVSAAKQIGIELTADKRAQLMQAYLELEAWPDVLPALRLLKEAGMRLVFLSNMTRRLLEAGIRNSALEGLFEQVLSTDQIKAYKPEPRAYQMGIDALGLKPESILFAAFAGWDVAGAKWFGYPTFWVNRLNSPSEELGVSADAAGRDLMDLARFVTAH
jgi:2-haloacid dehalogenase